MCAIAESAPTLFLDMTLHGLVQISLEWRPGGLEPPSGLAAKKRTLVYVGVARFR
jgi:hypothetical protein